MQIDAKLGISGLIILWRNNDTNTTIKTDALYYIHTT